MRSQSWLGTTVAFVLAPAAVHAAGTCSADTARIGADVERFTSLPFAILEQSAKGIEAGLVDVYNTATRAASVTQWMMHQIRSAQQGNGVSDAMGDGFMMFFGGDDKGFVSLQLTGDGRCQEDSLPLKGIELSLRKPGSSGPADHDWGSVSAQDWATSTCARGETCVGRLLGSGADVTPDVGCSDSALLGCRAHQGSSGTCALRPPCILEGQDKETQLWAPLSGSFLAADCSSNAAERAQAEQTCGGDASCVATSDCIDANVRLYSCASPNVRAGTVLLEEPRRWTTYDPTGRGWYTSGLAAYKPECTAATQTDAASVTACGNANAYGKSTASACTTAGACVYTPEQHITTAEQWSNVYPFASGGIGLTASRVVPAASGSGIAGMLAIDYSLVLLTRWLQDQFAVDPEPKTCPGSPSDTELLGQVFVLDRSDNYKLIGTSSPSFGPPTKTTRDPFSSSPLLMKHAADYLRSRSWPEAAAIVTPSREWIDRCGTLSTSSSESDIYIRRISIRSTNITDDSRGLRWMAVAIAVQRVQCGEITVADGGGTLKEANPDQTECVCKRGYRDTWTNDEADTQCIRCDTQDTPGLDQDGRHLLGDNLVPPFACFGGREVVASRGHFVDIMHSDSSFKKWKKLKQLQKVTFQK